MSDSIAMVYVFRDGRYDVMPGDAVHVRWGYKYPAWQARVPYAIGDTSADLADKAYTALRVAGYTIPRPTAINGSAEVPR